jgi:hypothetical protein
VFVFVVFAVVISISSFRARHFELVASLLAGSTRVGSIRAGSNAVARPIPILLTLWKNADPDIPRVKEAKEKYAKLRR